MSGSAGQQRLDHRLLDEVGEQDEQGPAPEAGEGVGEGARRSRTRPAPAASSGNIARSPGRPGGRRVPGGTTARTVASKATRPARSPRRVATEVSAIAASMACSTRGTPATWPAITRPLSSRVMTVWFCSARYVRTMGSAGAGGGGPVDAAGLVVGRVVAQLVELGAAAAALGRAEAGLLAPGPAHAQLGLVARREAAGTPEDPARAASGCAGGRAGRAGPRCAPRRRSARSGPGADGRSVASTSTTSRRAHVHAEPPPGRTQRRAPAGRPPRRAGPGRRGARPATQLGHRAVEHAPRAAGARSTLMRRGDGADHAGRPARPPR